MKLEKIQFEDFKSISEGSLDIEKGITTLVGINESGKSNILFAIEKIDKKQKLDNHDIRKSSEKVYDTNASPKLTLTFSLESKESDGLFSLLGLSQSKDLQKVVVSKEKDKYNLEYPGVVYDKSSLTASIKINVDETTLTKKDEEIKNSKVNLAAKKKELSVNKDEEAKKKISDEIVALENALKIFEEQREAIKAALDIDKENKTKERNLSMRQTIIDKIVKEYLPKVLLFDSVGIEDYYLPKDGRVEIDKLIATPNKYKQIINLLSLGGIKDLTILQPGDSKKNDLRKQKLNQASDKINKEVLRKHWPLEDVEFSLTAEETNILCIHLKEKDDQSVFVPSDRSRGLQWSIAFNIYFLAESQGDLKNSILLIDEPGVFLHIDAQKKLLKETFPAILKGNNQIIYTTHLPYLIDPEYPERIRILERKSKCGDTIIGNKAWSEGKISEIPEPVKTALGTKWTEWFSAKDKNCMVEGPSDQVILRALTSKLGEDFHFISAYSKDSIPRALALSKIDEKNAVGITDNDTTEKEYERLVEKLHLVDIPEEVLIKLDILTDNAKVATIEDVIPESFYKEAVWAVYSDTLSQISDDFKAENIPVDFPRVKNFQEYYKKISGKECNTFRKMELARMIAEIVSRLETPADNSQKWTTVRKIIKSLNDSLSKQTLFESYKSLVEKNAAENVSKIAGHISTDLQKTTVAKVK